jgi:putative heme degradation protein
MTRHSATIERTSTAAYDAFESPILPRAADLAQLDDDAVMDSWLASLDTHEFEVILSRLAASDARRSSGLEYTA